MMRIKDRIRISYNISCCFFFFCFTSIRSFGPSSSRRPSLPNSSTSYILIIGIWKMHMNGAMRIVLYFVVVIRDIFRLTSRDMGHCNNVTLWDIKVEMCVGRRWKKTVERFRVICHCYKLFSIFAAGDGENWLNRNKGSPVICHIEWTHTAHGKCRKMPKENTESRVALHSTGQKYTAKWIAELCDCNCQV